MHRLQMNHQNGKGVDHCWTFFYVDQIKVHWVQSDNIQLFGHWGSTVISYDSETAIFLIFFLQTNKKKSQNHL